MKVVQVVHDFLPNHPGGTEIHAWQLSRALMARGVEVTVLATERSEDEEQGSHRDFEVGGVPVREVVWNDAFSDFAEREREPVTGEALSAALADLAPDVVHFHHTAHWGADALRRAQESGAAVIATLHDYYALCLRSTFLQPGGVRCDTAVPSVCASCIPPWPVEPTRYGLEEGQEKAARVSAVGARQGFTLAALDHADLLISPSRTLRDVYAVHGVSRDRVAVVPHGLPPAVESEGIAPRPDGDRLVCGFLGLINEPKGADLLVRAFQDPALAAVARCEMWGVVDWFPDYVASLVELGAGGPAVASGSEEDTVALMGPYEPDQASAVLARFDLLVIPSIWLENAPLTILEAYRSGLPVVASDLGGMAESVEDGRSGWTFAVGDAGALGALLARLADDRDEVARCSAGVPAVRSMDDLAAEIEDLYGDLVAP